MIGQSEMAPDDRGRRSRYCFAFAFAFALAFAFFMAAGSVGTTCPVRAAECFG